MEEWILVDLMNYSGSEYDYVLPSDTHANTIIFSAEVINISQLIEISLKKIKY